MIEAIDEFAGDHLRTSEFIDDNSSLLLPKKASTKFNTNTDIAIAWWGWQDGVVVRVCALWPQCISFESRSLPMLMMEGSSPYIDPFFMIIIVKNASFDPLGFWPLIKSILLYYYYETDWNIEIVIGTASDKNYHTHSLCIQV